jgi:hypothetical protein
VEHERGVSAKTVSAIAHYLNILNIERTTAKEFGKEKRKRKSPAIPRTLSHEAK